MGTGTATGAAKKPVLIVQGAQWGSEGKGAITAFLCHNRNVDIAIRTGTVNAGHTAYYRGQPYVCQQLPVGWVNPNTQLVIGPGAFIHPDILFREIVMIEEATGVSVLPRLWVDYRCGLHLPAHTVKAKVANRHHSMGATGKGCSEAVMAKIRGRGDDGQLYHEWLGELGATVRGRGVPLADTLMYDILNQVKTVDTVDMVNQAWDQGKQLLIEGTQGTMLDLHLGPYPYVTHKQTQCASWMAEAGLSPALPVEIVLVARTFPIRVAGNSGPMPQEIPWCMLARDINLRLSQFDLPPRVQEESLQAFEAACQAVVLANLSIFHDGFDNTNANIEDWSQEEREAYPEFVSELHRTALAALPPETIADLSHLFELTTVTRKLRRIAELNVDTLSRSIQLNRPAYVALTFADYVFPELYKANFTAVDRSESRRQLLHFIEGLEDELDTEIRYITTGPDTSHVIPVDALIQEESEIKGRRDVQLS